MPFGIFYIFRVQNSTLLPLDKGHFITGNGFRPSETSVNIHGLLNGEWSVHTLGNGLAHSVGEAAFADVFIIDLAGYSDNLALCQIIGCVNSASRSERINPFPTKKTTFSHSTSRQIPICSSAESRQYAHFYQGGHYFPPWMYLWSQSASKSRLPISMGQPVHKSSASSRRVSAGSRHSR